jgi:putative membrane protein
VKALARPVQKHDLRDYIAAEQTFLAWIRTGVSLMGFGFVVARFGLFLRELQYTKLSVSSRSFGLSIWFGTALIVIGVLANAFSAWHHVALVRQLNRGDEEFNRPSSPAIIVAVILALLGLAMAIYLISF